MGAISVDKMGTIDLGRQGENLAKTIEIDVTSILAKWPEAIITLLVKRKGDVDPYFAEATVKDGILTWPITKVETAVVGDGKIEIQAVDGDIIAKSVTGTIRVNASLSGSVSDELPDVHPSWVDQVLNGAGTGGSGGTVALDTTLSVAGKAADAKATGDRLTALSGEKLDKHQGTENANKLLIVGDSGDVVGAKVGDGLEVTYGTGKNIFHGEWENARYNNGSFTTVTSGKNYIAVRELFQVKPNTAYTISRQTAPNCVEIFFYLQQFSADKSWISGTASIAGDDFVKLASKSFTTGENTHFLAIYCYAPKGESWQDMIPGGLMIEEGTTATQYEEYGVIEAEIKLKDANVIPSYWDDQIEQKIASVNRLHKELGKDCFSFIVIADMHYYNNLGKLSPSLAKSIMDACDIKYAYALGDFTGSNSLNQKDKLLEEMENVETMLSPIRDRLLVVQGNHDGTWGSVDQNADGTITSPERHSYIITPGEMHHWLFRKVGLIGNVHFDETGTAYYIDDTASRVRYIALNSSCLDYELDNNGYSKYNAMAMFRFTQKQYDFLVEALMDGLDERWSVVIGAHAPLVAYETMWNGETGVEYTLMRDFLTAFRNKTSFSGSFAGTADNGFDDVSIEADFTKAEATLIGYFAGHIHDDYHYPHTTHGIDIIGIGADRQREEMTAGTDTEQSFDVITVDKKNHKIYCTKIGFGNNREISYA